jgi:hypothetical protein
MTRYVMTIGEATNLVIMSAAVSATERYDASHAIYMLDMGDPVSIMTVAETMIRLSGKKPRQDIEIVVTGKRPGEKLHEALCAPGEEMISVDAPSIFGLRTPVVRWTEIQAMLRLLGAAVERGDRQSARTIMKAFCQPRRLLRQVDKAADFEAIPGATNGSSEHDFAPLSGKAANARADGLEVSNGGPAPRADGRNGSGVPVAGPDHVDIPVVSEWPEEPRPDETLDEPRPTFAHLHSERGSARRH